MKQKKAFTLIELLIVVAIIAILAAIAVPNFLEAQTRAKVSRTKADMRSMKTAIEAYFIDYNHHPVGRSCNSVWVAGKLEGPSKNRLVLITTPISYMTSIPSDPWGTNFTAVGFEPCDEPSFIYLKFAYHKNISPRGNLAWYLGLVPGSPESPSLFSDDPLWTIWPVGLTPGWILVADGPWRERTDGVTSIPYDATNGTISFGQIFDYGSAGNPND